MPYNNILNADSLALMYSAKFFTLKECKDLLAVLNSCDFSVIASRREAHVALNVFVENARVGERLFDLDRRFPVGLTSHFLSDADGPISNWISATSSILSYRSSNVAKDSALAVERDSERLSLVKDQGEQDAFKQFTELKKVLTGLLNASIVRWNRATFESRVAGNWENPAAPA